MMQCLGPTRNFTPPTLCQGCERQGPWVRQRVRCTGAVELGRDLGKLRVEEIMNREPIAVHDSTMIGQAIMIIREKHLQNLPVERDGEVAYHRRNEESFVEVV